MEAREKKGSSGRGDSRSKVDIVRKKKKKRKEEKLWEVYIVVGLAREHA